MKAVQGRSKSTEGKSQHMSLRRQIVMQISNSTHTSSLHKSRIIFVFKYFLPQLQSAWGGWERVICKHKNSYDFKSSLLETNGTYTPKEQTSNQRCLCSFSKWTEKLSCSRTGQKEKHFFNQRRAEKVLLRASSYPSLPHLCQSWLRSATHLHHHAASTASSTSEVLYGTFNITDGGLTAEYI